ncbi:MAG: hypothetical protein QNJ78_10700 [Gammaproteobacteria bacterium]|nr:hypothetical protein [Gammaproteobacteria bacterium]
MTSNPRKISPASPWSFLLPSLLLGGLCSWLLEHHYLNDRALLHWTKLLSMLDANEIHLEYIGLMHPHVPIYLLAPLYYLPGLASPAAPYLLSVLSGGLLLAIWNYHLRLKRYALRSRVLLVLLAAANPLFLWAVTNGSEMALSLLMYYLFCFAVLRTLLQRDSRAIIMLSSALAGYFFVDARTFYLVIAFLPLIPLVAPPNMLRESPLSVFFVISLPVALAAASWFYLNWIFHGDARTFITVPDSAFLGELLNSRENLWLLEFGGSWIVPTLLALLLAIAAFPGMLWQARVIWRSPRLRRALLTFFLVPVLAVGVSSSRYFLSHPMEMLFLLNAACMVGLLLLPRARMKQKALAALFLLLGDLTSGIILYRFASPDMAAWRLAISGQGNAAIHQEELRLGQFLAMHRLPTLLDERAGYRIVAARGDTQQLVLSYMPEFKLALQRSDPAVAQLVVFNPADRRAYLDRVTQQYPELFTDGMPGYRLVYRSPNWHVYRQEAVLQ